MEWKNRIVGYGTKPADQFLYNPLNPRIHPARQQQATRGSLDTLGWIAPVIENARTGYLVDGHDRVWHALQNGNADVPYITVDLSENEERLAITTYDFITGMADYDREAVERLLHEVNTTNADMMQLLADIAEMEGVIPPDPFEEDRPPVDRTVECPACGERFEG